MVKNRNQAKVQCLLHYSKLIVGEALLEQFKDIPFAFLPKWFQWQMRKFSKKGLTESKLQSCSENQLK